MRWLAHRGGALDFREWKKAQSGSSVSRGRGAGADPATILAAVTPIPDTLSGICICRFAAGSRSEVTQCLLSDLQVPASAEFVLEGVFTPKIPPRGSFW